MNWMRVILDGLAMSAVFNLCTALVWRLHPDAFLSSYPKSIRDVVPPNPKQRKLKTRFVLFMILPVTLYGILSACQAGINGFWNLALAGYIEWLLVNLGDFFGLDLYFRETMGDRLVLPGTKGDPFYTRRGWMKALGLPEHGLLWPFLVCPLFAVLSAGAGLLLRAVL
ncbi:hypothetical protein HCH52_01755 [Oscillospiraceae bacterium HV4-5-C5C]|nr:hypothetical protein [Oscillospiraceae bacterium HV4-5-C5C]